MSADAPIPIVAALAGQETAIFLTMLALRGGGNYRLPADMVCAFYVEGAPLSRASFAALSAGSLPAIGIAAASEHVSAASST